MDGIVLLAILILYLLECEMWSTDPLDKAVLDPEFILRRSNWNTRRVPRNILIPLIIRSHKRVRNHYSTQEEIMMEYRLWMTIVCYFENIKRL